MSTQAAIYLKPVGDDLAILDQPPAFTDATWYLCSSTGTLSTAIDPIVTRDIGFVTIDVTVGWDHFITFSMRSYRGDEMLQEWWFSALNWCQTRLVFPVTTTEFDRLDLSVRRKPVGPAPFAVGPVRLTRERPARLETPALPRGPIVDEIGQYRHAHWASKTESADEMVQRLQAHAPSRPQPADWSRWGGDASTTFAATGYFRTEHDGRRWWLVDPDGHAFWSAGADCVHPTIDHEARFETTDMNTRAAFTWLPEDDPTYAEAIGRNPWHAPDDREMNFVVANFIRAFGADQWRANWERQVFADMRDLGFNTAGDWSDEDACSRHQFPYCRALELHLEFSHTPMLFRRLPDVYHPGLAADLATYAEQLRDTVDDPAMIGYFMHNEPAWHFGDGFRTPAEEMLRQNIGGETRKQLVQFMSDRHGDIAGVAAAWGMDVDQATLSSSTMSTFSDAARVDLEDFSTELLTVLIDAMSAACRAVDPHHLNLGVRWWTCPPIWALRAMGSADVISFNYYQPTFDFVSYTRRERDPRLDGTLAELGRPFVVGEWHIGCLNQGLASAALLATSSEAERAKAYRVYIESAAADPWCVGAHWFNLYDRTALYCAQNSENYHIGLMDVTQRRFEPTCAAARASHERLYRVARGDVPPFAEPVDYMYPSR